MIGRSFAREMAKSILYSFKTFFIIFVLCVFQPFKDLIEAMIKKIGKNKND